MKTRYLFASLCIIVGIKTIFPSAIIYDTKYKIFKEYNQEGGKMNFKKFRERQFINRLEKQVEQIHQGKAKTMIG